MASCISVDRIDLAYSKQPVPGIGTYSRYDEKMTFRRLLLRFSSIFFHLSYWFIMVYRPFQDSSPVFFDWSGPDVHFFYAWLV